MKGISLFSSGGIADLAFEKSGINIILANEIIPERAFVYKHNFPDTEVIIGNIWEKQAEIISRTVELLNGEELDFFIATPPCQGMSKNGQGKLLNLIRSQKRPKIDPRNRLILPTMNIAKALNPCVIVLENVSEMYNAIIDDENGNYVNIIDFIRTKLDEDYEGKAEVVEFADYGVPQRRKRLITVFTRNGNLKKVFHHTNTLLPKRTHSSKPNTHFKKWVSVKDTLVGLPRLDAKDKVSSTSDIPYHSVPVLEKKKYFWISNTPPEKGAFDNQCINPICGYKGNMSHGSERNGDGINKAKTSTPLYCVKCGSLLPRPYVEVNGVKRLMNGYTSAYKRMRWDLPSPTLTTNLCYPSSDHKVHPEQNRVLSLYEAFKLHTLDKFKYEWRYKDSINATDTLIRDVIGESIPPYGMYIIVSHLLKIISGNFEDEMVGQLSLSGDNI